MVMSLKSSARGPQVAVGMSEGGYPIIPTLTLAFNRLSIPEKQTGFIGKFLYPKKVVQFMGVSFICVDQWLYTGKKTFSKISKKTNGKFRIKY
mgnify:CR=1 FL=1